MKTRRTAVALFCVLLLLGGCARVGGEDSLDFLSGMEERGYICTVEETQSGGEIIESCYVGDYKLTMASNAKGKLSRVTLTYAGTADAGEFLPLASACIEAMCEYTASQAESVLKSLGINEALPGSTNGVAQCATQWFLFSFTSQEPGGQLIVDSLRLNPTSAPTVTVRTTVRSPEEAEPSS